MNDDFKKLDTFMRQNRPAELSTRSLDLPRSNRLPWIGAITAAMIMVGVFTNVRIQQAYRAEAELAINDAIQWEYEAEDLSAEVNDMVALAE